MIYRWHQWCFKVVFVLLIVGCPVGVFAAAQPLQLSFAQACQAALMQTPRMLLSRARIAEAQGAVQSARGHLLPQLNAAYTASGTDSAMSVFGMKLSQGRASFNDFGAGEFNPMVPASLYNEPDNLNDPGWTRNYQSKLELLVPIFNGGKVYGYLSKAKAYLAAANHGDEMARQQLLFQVLKAYEGVHTAQAFVAVADKAVAAAQSYADLTDKLYAQGVVAHNDQLRAHLNLSATQLKQSEARTYLGKSYDQLRVLVGIDADQSFSVAQQLDIAMPQGDLAVLRQQMLRHNPGLQALEQKVAAGSADVKIACADYLPHFNLMLRREWNSDDYKLGGNPSSTVAGVLSWNLLDFGSRRGAVNQANARLNQENARLNRARDQLIVQLDAAWRDAVLADERVKVCAFAITQAEEAERLELLRYQQGVSTMADLLNIQAQLDKARSDQVAAHYQQIMQRAGLLLALGRLTEDAATTTPWQ